MQKINFQLRSPKIWLILGSKSIIYGDKCKNFLKFHITKKWSQIRLIQAVNLDVYKHKYLRKEYLKYRICNKWSQIRLFKALNLLFIKLNAKNKLSIKKSWNIEFPKMNLKFLEYWWGFYGTELVILRLAFKNVVFVFSFDIFYLKVS
jgi:hypothetical protein